MHSLFTTLTEQFKGTEVIAFFLFLQVKHKAAFYFFSKKEPLEGGGEIRTVRSFKISLVRDPALKLTSQSLVF